MGRLTVREVLDSLRRTTFSIHPHPVSASPDDAAYPLVSIDAAYRVTLLIGGAGGEGISSQFVRGRIFDTEDIVVVPLRDQEEFMTWMFDEDGVPRNDFPVRPPASLLDSRSDRVMYTMTLIHMAQVMTGPPFSLPRAGVITLLGTDEVVGVTAQLTQCLVKHRV